MSILAIDPGPAQSAYALIDVATRRPRSVGKLPNDQLLGFLASDYDHDRAERVAIEMVASYGMTVGREVFETCVWIGRFLERSPVGAELVYRRDVKVHHCHSANAKDPNIVQALIDRFAPGAPNRGKGTRAEPGWFFGFADDIWQAYALAVRVADVEQGYQP